MLAGLALAGACTTPNAPVSSRFPPGSVASPAGPIVVEVGNAHYRDRGVRLVVKIHNETKEEVVVEREGILLAYGGLEFAAQPEAHGAPAPQTRIGPDQEVSLDVSFETGHALREPTHLMIRAAKSGDRWLDPTSVEVPPMPAGNER